MTEEKVRGIDNRFKLLMREADLISGFLSSGLASMSSINKGDSFYYQSFYLLSVGIERLLKLIILSGERGKNVRGFNHEIKKLLSKVGISFEKDSVEQEIIDFLDLFASKNRYTIPDILASGDEQQLQREPMADFYEKIIKKILKKIPIEKSGPLPDLSNFAVMLHVKENFNIDSDANHLWTLGSERGHIAKHCVMYMGRILQPCIKKLEDLGGQDLGNPYFNEIFPYLKGDDEYFKTHKLFRRK